MTTDLDEVTSRHRAPDVTSASPLPQVPMGQVGWVGSWNMQLDGDAYAPGQLQVDDCIVFVTVALDTVDDHVTLTGVELDDLANTEVWSGVVVHRVTAVNDVCLFKVTGRCYLYAYIYRGVGRDELLLHYIDTMQWRNTANPSSSSLRGVQDEISYPVATALVGTASHVLCATYANTPGNLLDPIEYFPNDLGFVQSTTFAATGNPAIDPDKTVKIEYFDNANRNGFVDEHVLTSAYGQWDEDYATGWGSIDFHTIILATQRVPVLEDDLGNAAPIGNARLPIFTKPDD